MKEAVIHGERAPQHVSGDVDLAAESALRRRHHGAHQDMEDTMADCPPPRGAVVCRGQW